MGRRTSLYEAHRRLGARLVDFAGWEMPVGYGDAGAEHRLVRTRCGLFDVSHMGELRLRGAQAATVWQRLTTNDVRRLNDGDAQYTVACDEEGGILDDLVLYRFGPEDFLAVVNAANTPGMRIWLERHVAGTAGVEVGDETDQWALLALQGPMAADVLGPLAPALAADQRPFTIRALEVDGIACLASRTGYTGEDGFELFVPWASAEAVWQPLCDAVVAAGGSPAGLAARDTLRLEAGFALCGTDMGRDTSPLEAGLAWVVRFVDGNDFVGRAALEAARAAGVRRRLVCFELDAAGVPRHGFEIRCAGRSVGVVTSGARSPTLGRFIGMGYVASECAAPGTTVEVVVRGRPVTGRVVPRPFYRRAR